jgi:membrane-bound ClpP family serine protease
MSIGTGVVLFVIGAILVFAPNFDLGGVVNIDAVGYILMVAGAIVFVIGLVALFRRRSAVSTTRTGADPVSGERVTQRVTEADDPVV